MKTASEILAKYEDENEYHLYQSDREWIFQAMHEFANQSRWISVKEHGLPKEDGKYLFVDDMLFTWINKFYAGESIKMYPEVRFWQPLPSAPREE